MHIRIMYRAALLIIAQPFTHCAYPQMNGRPELSCVTGYETIDPPRGSHHHSIILAARRTTMSLLLLSDTGM